MNPSDRRLTTDRCAKLCLIAIVNKIDEAWITLSPVLITMYASQYLPSIFRSIMAKIGVRVGMKFRDSRNDLVDTASISKQKD